MKYIFKNLSGTWDKCLGLVHWDDPEGWDGRGVQDGEHM